MFTCCGFKRFQLYVFLFISVFQERALKPPPLRQFHRTFIIVPQGSGFVIVNDSLFITNAIGPQVKAAFQTETSIMSKLSPEEKQRLVNILCQKTIYLGQTSRLSAPKQD